MTHRYRINIVGNAPYDYPTETLFGLLFCKNGEVMEIPQNYPFEGEWGNTSEVCVYNNDGVIMPSKLEIVWLSLVEKQFYELSTELPYEELESLWDISDPTANTPLYDTLIIGMCPGGHVAIWFYGQLKSELVGWYKANETTVPMALFIPNHPDLSVEEYCDKYLGSLHPLNASINLSSFPKRMDKYMYRYVVYFEKWSQDNGTWEKHQDKDDELEIVYINETLYDGTHDKLHDGGLMKYHEAGKPKKLALKWHIKKSDYSAYFWFEEEEICAIFNKFYGQHPDTKTDFIIHIDPIKKKYELSLYRYGLKEPVIIPESAYQLIVFKSGFENYRSDNYNQPTGAWIW